MDFKLLMDCRQYLSVAHHVPGRIRLRFSLGVLSDPRAMELLSSVRDAEMPPALRNARLNLPARSVILEYDPKAISPELLEEVLSTTDDHRFKSLAEKLKTLAGQA